MCNVRSPEYFNHVMRDTTAHGLITDHACSCVEVRGKAAEGLPEARPFHVQANL